MKSFKGLALVIGLGVTALASCGSDSEPGADAVTSVEVASPGSVSSSPAATTASTPTSQGAVDDSASALDAVIAYADDWSIALTGDEVECLAENLGEEFASTGGSFAEADVPFFLVGCDVDVGVASGGNGRSPLEAIVAVLLIDEDVEPTEGTIICATNALIAGFGADGFIDLLTSRDEPSSDDDAIAEGAFDACGLDGTAIVGG